MKVSVHRNLNKRDDVWYSIRHKNKVIDYRRKLIIRQAIFKHPTPNAIKRIRTKHREVANWITGYLDDSDITLPEVLNDVLDSLTRIECDPKKFDFFTNADTNQKIDKADLVLLNSEGCYSCQTITNLPLMNGKSIWDHSLIISSKRPESAEQIL